MLALPATVALAAAMAAPPAAAAQHGDGHYDTTQYDTSQGAPGEYGIAVDSLNDSGATGSALLTLAEDGSLTVSVEADGLAPGLVHAQHIHGDADLTQDFSCPPPEADEDGDGFVDVAEGVPFYGGIHIALTTEGDSSPESGLAVDRMPVADENGQLSYSRTFSREDLPDGTAAAVRNLHIVIHGIDINENGEYDFDANGESELDPQVPFEATVPAACGIVEGANIAEVPEGGVDTGNSPLTSSTRQSTLVAGAVLALGLVWFGLRQWRRAVPR
jgi:hypothetical protein